jgi:hypothetical protein
MIRAFQILYFHIQRTALICWLLIFALSPAVLTEANRLVENNATEEVCALTGVAVSEVSVRKRKMRASNVAVSATVPTNILQNSSVPEVLLPQRSLEISLRKLRL